MGKWKKGKGAGKPGQGKGEHSPEQPSEEGLKGKGKAKRGGRLDLSVSGTQCFFAIQR